MERTCTLKGTPLELAGPELKVGDAAPVATLKKSLVDDFNLADVAGKPRVYSVVPSLDTPVCSEQTRRFNQEVANHANVQFFTISCDLPVAMNRFCSAESINTERLTPLSDHMETAFGKAYGVLIPKLRILCRAVFVVGEDNKIKYVEYVPEIASHPNYDAALACLRSL